MEKNKLKYLRLVRGLTQKVAADYLKDRPLMALMNEENCKYHKIIRKAWKNRIT